MGGGPRSPRLHAARHVRFWWILGAIAVPALLVRLAFWVSPWPGALLIRYVFERDAAKVKKAMEAYAPQGVASIVDQPYRSGDKDARLDVYFPVAVDQPGVRLPALVWTHGGAWVSGYKDDAAPYFRLIAAEGYTVISLDYSLAPHRTYPTPVHQVNDALAYIQEHAGRLHVDVNRIVMAGDSAGAQITGQVAALITNPAYAAELGLAPSLRCDQLRGLVLHCGFYDIRAFLDRARVAPSRAVRWGMATIVWAYTGSRERDSTTLRQMSSINHVTPDFPPTFISGGHDDPLTDAQSRPLAARLQELGVDVTTLFYEKEHQPPLGHEYQFMLDGADAQNALTQTLAFLKQRTSS